MLFSGWSLFVIRRAVSTFFVSCFLVTFPTANAHAVVGARHFSNLTEALEEDDFEYTEVVQRLIAAHTPRCGTSLPAELSFNSMRTAERLTKAPSKVSNAQLQAAHIKSIASNMALDGPTAFKARSPADLRRYMSRVA